MRGEAKGIFSVEATRDEDRLGHVERNERKPAAVFGKARPGRRCTLSVIEETVALAEYEVVLVPKAVLALQPKRVCDHVVDRVVVGLGPRADHLQRLPIALPLLGLGRNPGVPLRRL